jgi:hypothetical protein
MASLILQKLENAIKTSRAKLVIISDIAATFQDKDINHQEAKTIYSQILSKLAQIAKHEKATIIATYPPHQDTPRNIQFKAQTQEKANVVLNLHHAKYARQIILEKHHTYKTGSIELRTEKLQLNHFLEVQ